MVQKIAKKGVHSGNTLRASNSKYNRDYSKKAGLFRRSTNPTIAAKGTILDDLNIGSDNVVYSLNKKGRWEVPQMLKESILAGNYKDLTTNVKLVLSHNLAKKSHSIGFYASRGKVKKVEGKKTYFNYDSVQSQADRINNFDHTRNDLQIDVVYPCPTTSSVLHNPKYVGHHIEKAENGRGKTSTSRKHRQKLTVQAYCRDVDDESYDWDQSDDEIEPDEDLAQYMYTDKNKTLETNTELLEDIMVHAALMQSICQTNCQRMPRKVQINDTKCKKIYTVEDNANVSPDDSEIVHQPTAVAALNEKRTVMEPVYVIVPRKEVETCALQHSYGNRYKECACFPRKFLIDVSDRMKHRMDTSSVLKIDKYNGRSFDVTSCLVFTQDDDDVNNSDSQCVLKVSLNIGTDAEVLKIWTLFDYFEGYLEHVIERTVVFLDMMSTDTLKNIETEPTRTTTGLKFENLNDSQKITKSTASITRKKCFDEIFNDQDNCSDFDFEIVQSDCCGICFEEFGAGGKPGTALSSCGHWFCDDCWVDHCRSRMNMGSLLIPCPEHGCDERVPDSVLLAFANIFDVLNMKKRENELRVETLGNCKWCPNPYCNRVIQVSRVEKVNDITCTCGSQLCFQCLKPPHWPVPCQDVETYWKRLKRLGDDISYQESVKVRGKQCPKCRRFVEKLGGCFYMSCVCGAAFCWGCLKTYPGHVYSESCNQYKNGDLKGTKTMEVHELESYETVKASRSGDYKRAVNHRKARHPIVLGKLRTGVRQISLKCKNPAKKKGPVYFNMFGADVLSGSQTVEDGIRQLLSNSISVYTEIHHIVEHCYVLLDKRKDRAKFGQFRGKLMSLGFCADSIREILTHPVEMKDCRSVITTLQHIQLKSTNLTKSVVCFVEKYLR